MTLTSLSPPPPSSSSSATSSTSRLSSATLKPHFPHHYPVSRTSTSSGRTTSDWHSSRADGRSLAPSSAGSAVGTSISAQTGQSGQEAKGVKNPFKTMLPITKHAVFAAKLTIHQLWNVPLVSGSFSVRWKFAHVHRLKRYPPSASAAQQHTNGSAQPRKSFASSLNVMGKGKGREQLLGGDSEYEQDGRQDYQEGEQTPSSGASILSVPSAHSEDSSSISTSPQSTSIDLPHSKTAAFDALVQGGFEYWQEGRGRTDYKELKEHHVKWGKEVFVAVQLGVSRDGAELQPCELKLVIEQETTPGDPDAPQNPRLGVVRLNLAEYVDEGPVTRRYLLRESKTNATLQLTLELTLLGGETSFKAPPLSKGEVMAGVATLLEKNGLSGGFGSSRALLSKPVPSVRTHRKAVDNGSRSGFSSLSTGRRLPDIVGPGGAGTSTKTTDNIIEAIFNPVPSSSTSVSPFTYFSPQEQAQKMKVKEMNRSGLLAPSAAVQEEGEEEEERPPSIAPSERSQQSLGTDATHETTTTNVSNASAEGGSRLKWWKRLGGSSSRPQSPQQQPSTAPTSSTTPAPANIHPYPTHEMASRTNSTASTSTESEVVSVHSLPPDILQATDPSKLNVELKMDDPKSSSAPQIVVRGPMLSPQAEHFPDPPIAEVAPPPETR